MVSSKTDEYNRWDLYLQFASRYGVFIAWGGGDWIFLVEDKVKKYMRNS